MIRDVLIDMSVGLLFRDAFFSTQCNFPDIQIECVCVFIVVQFAL